MRLTVEGRRRSALGRLIELGVVLATLTCGAIACAQTLPLDVDGDGQVDPFTDVVFIERFLLGLPPVPPSMRATNPDLPSDAVIAARIEAIAGTPRPTPTAPATPVSTSTSTRAPSPTRTASSTSSPTVTATRTRTRTATASASVSGTPTGTPTTQPTPRVMEGADVVRGSAEVAVQNVESVSVLDFGCVGARCAALQSGARSRLGIRRRTAMQTGEAAGGGLPPCATVTCQSALQDGRQVGIQTIHYDDCVETTASNHAVTRNGTAVLTVENPTFCQTMQVDPARDTVTLQLTGFSLVERDAADVVLVNYSADLSDAFDPDQEGCTPAGDEQPAIDGTQQLDGAITFSCLAGAESLPCERGRTELSLTVHHLLIRRQSGGFPCELGLTLNGELSVDDFDLDQDGNRCETHYAQRFADFFIAAAPQADGTTTVRENGTLSVDALGDLIFDTEKDDSGGPPGQNGSFTFPASADCPTGGDGRLEVRRPPMVAADAAAAADASGGIAGQQANEFRHQLYRSTNGPVYQVLQNVDAFKSFGAEAVQVTTVIGSEAGGVGECAFTAGATVEPQAVAAVEPGRAFPLAAVRKSAIIPFADVPIFNRNGSAGDGVLCIGPGCVGGASCPSGAPCQLFTMQSGVAATQATAGIPAAQLLPALPAFRNTVGCVGFQDLSTYRFGDNGPTVEVRQCSLFPQAPSGNGFRIPNGSSVVLAYDASFASLFNAAAAGFPIDVDGNNLIGCDPSGNRVLHLGIATLQSVEAPIIRFGSNGANATTSFDFLGDGTQTQTVRGCVGISPLSMCTAGGANLRHESGAGVHSTGSASVAGICLETAPRNDAERRASWLISPRGTAPPQRARLRSVGWLVRLLLVGCLSSSAAIAQLCGGDCSGNGTVAINELVTCVNAALGALTSCAACDGDGNGTVAINDLVSAVNHALGGCPVPTPTATPVPGGATPTPTMSPSALPTTAGNGFQTVAVGAQGAMRMGLAAQRWLAALNGLGPLIDPDVPSCAGGSATRGRSS